MWSLLCQTAYNLKKFLQLYYAEEIGEEKLFKLGLVITDFGEGIGPLLVMPKSASFAANYYDIEIY